MNEEQLRERLISTVPSMTYANESEIIAIENICKAYAETRVKGITLPPIPLKLVIGFLGHRAKCPLTQREYMFHEGQVSIRVRISMEEIGKATTLEEASVIIEADRNQFLRGHLS